MTSPDCTYQTEFTIRVQHAYSLSSARYDCLLSETVAGRTVLRPRKYIRTVKDFTDFENLHFMQSC
jgi:hypothetical protein